MDLQVKDALIIEGLRVWVTGASRGLGRAIAAGLMDCGAFVALTARSESSLDAFAAMRPEPARQCLVVPGSVTDRQALERIAARIEDSWGGLDAVVNCAGVSPTMSRSEAVTESEWSEVLDVNLTGLFACCQVAYKILADGGSIVNIASILGSVGTPRLAAYSATKGGIHALTRTLALEWAHRGVRVNSVSPGYFETDLTKGLREHPVHSKALLDRVPLGRFGTAAELVPLVQFLISPGSSYVTGADFTIDGGWSAQ